ncbi:MAG: HNH endonuclease signature motif containing protein [Candidatus Latescibacterota bacterium]|nr:HNH endonuclease signature motif containing protein [Candidatus Latescibacterota bacterium]
MDAGNYYTPASEEHISREKDRARDLRRSQWWKNRLSQGRCHYCEQHFTTSALTMDHVVPIVRGGTSSKSNVVPCCKECNSQKRDLIPMEWDGYLTRKRSESSDPS